MNDDQGLVSTMVVILILLTIWLVYRSYVSAILFTPTFSQTSGSGPFGFIPGWAQGALKLQLLGNTNTIPAASIGAAGTPEITNVSQVA